MYNVLNDKYNHSSHFLQIINADPTLENDKNIAIMYEVIITNKHKRLVFAGNIIFIRIIYGLKMFNT